jgi:hypothetical protein
VIDAALRDLTLAGVHERPQTVLADTGYWHSEQTDQIVAAGTQVLIPPQSRTRDTIRPGWDTGRYAFMRAVLDSPAGSTLYHRRAQSMGRPSDRSNTTAASDSSDDEAALRSDRNGV